MVLFIINANQELKLYSTVNQQLSKSPFEGGKGDVRACTVTINDLHVKFSTLDSH